MTEPTGLPQPMNLTKAEQESFLAAMQDQQPTVQVPVSLIERAIDLIEERYSGRGPESTAGRLRALLSQPTPTAEAEWSVVLFNRGGHYRHVKVIGGDWDGAMEQAEGANAGWEALQCGPFVHGNGVSYHSTITAESPRVEDRNAWDAAVQAKRTEQRAKGYTAEHDREHGVEHLLLWAQDYASRGRHLDAAALVEAAREVLFWQRSAKSDHDLIDEQYRGIAPATEPPRIEDMAPGTTFTADGARYVVVRDVRVRSEAGWEHRNLDSIDPSTIRDVTPPAVTE